MEETYSKTLQLINEQYTAEIFEFFCHNYLSMLHKDSISLKELEYKLHKSIDNQIKTRLQGIIYEWNLNVICLDLDKDIVRDRKLEKLLDDDTLAIPLIKTEFKLFFRLNAASEFKQLKLVI